MLVSSIYIENLSRTQQGDKTMLVNSFFSNDATVDTKPAPQLLAGLDVELCIYVEGGDSLTIVMSESKGREIIEKLTNQLDKVGAIKTARQAADKQMLDSISSLSK